MESLHTCTVLCWLYSTNSLYCTVQNHANKLPYSTNEPCCYCFSMWLNMIKAKLDSKTNVVSSFSLHSTWPAGQPFGDYSLSLHYMCRAGSWSLQIISSVFQWIFADSKTLLNRGWQVPHPTKVNSPYFWTVYFEVMTYRPQDYRTTFQAHHPLESNDKYIVNCINKPSMKQNEVWYTLYISIRIFYTYSLYLPMA